jgi:uncharacterized protein (DUF488 family)
MQLLTAGYGNLGWDVFVERLRAHGVTHLVDVRSVPYSRYHWEFRREELERRAPGAGMRYVYMGDTLGGVPDSHLLCRDSDVDFSAIPLEERFQIGMKRLLEALADPNRILCLMCGCLRPHRCHRSRLLAPELEMRNVRVFHLDENGDAIPHDQVASAAAPLQLGLFSA